MSAGWVAGGVRVRAMVAGSMRHDGVRGIEAAGSLPAALLAASRTLSGAEVTPEMTVTDATRQIGAALLWRLRVIAGWLPPSGAGRMRALAGWFEIHDIVGRICELQGAPVSPRWKLGRLATVTDIGAARTIEEVRRRLRASAWRDPGSADPARVRTALLLRWADRVAGAASELAPLVADAVTLQEMRERRAGRSPLGDEDGSRQHSAGDIWDAELRWWTGAERTGRELYAHPIGSSEVVTGAAVLLAVEAHRTVAALESAWRKEAVHAGP